MTDEAAFYALIGSEFAGQDHQRTENLLRGVVGKRLTYETTTI